MRMSGVSVTYGIMALMAQQTETDAEPTRVVIDNESSLRSTVIDVFANDRPGLLYAIASTLLELKLSVMMAKIGTHVDQALDVFYVTHQGHKLGDDLQSELKSELLAACISPR